MYVDGHVKGFRGETIEETGAIVKVPERNGAQHVALVPVVADDAGQRRL